MKAQLLLLLIVAGFLLVGCKKTISDKNVITPTEEMKESVSITPEQVQENYSPTPTPRSLVNLDEVFFFSQSGITEHWGIEEAISYNDTFDFDNLVLAHEEDKLCAFYFSPHNNEHLEWVSLSYLDSDGKVNSELIEDARTFEELGLIYYGHLVDAKNNRAICMFFIATIPQIEAVFGGENHEKPYGHKYWDVEYAASREDLEQEGIIDLLK